MVFVLVVIVFFYGSTGNPTQSVSAVFASPNECVTAREAAIQKAEANSGVEGAAGVCLAVEQQDKL